MTAARTRLEGQDLEPGTTHRVAVREVHETVMRALVSTGASPGEAQVVAAAVSFAQIHLGEGIDAVARSLVGPCPPRTPVALEKGPVDVLVDRAHRSDLFLAPLAAGLVAARPAGAPVLVPDATWHPVWAGFLAPHCGPGAPPFAALEVRDGAVSRGVRTDPDGALHLLERGDEVISSRLRGQLPDLDRGEGVLVVRDLGGPPIDTSGRSHPPHELREQRRRALAGGLALPLEHWLPVYEASLRFLVPGE